MGKMVFIVLFVALIAAAALTIVKVMDITGVTPEMVQQAADSGMLPISLTTLIVVGVIVVVLVCAIVALALTLVVKFWVKVIRGIWLLIKLTYWSVKIAIKGIMATTRYVRKVIREANNDGTAEYKVRRPAFYSRIYNTPTGLRYRNAVSDFTAPTKELWGKFQDDEFMMGIFGKIGRLSGLILAQVADAFAGIYRVTRRWFIFRLCRNNVVRAAARMTVKVSRNITAVASLIKSSWLEAVASTRSYI